MEEEVVVHVVLECGANIEDQANNDPMEANDDDNNTIEEDGTHRLIQETFNVGMDDDDNIDGVFNIPVLEKEIQPLYEGSKTSLLYAMSLLMNLKVMKGLSNTYVTRLLSYVICFITFNK